MKLDEVPAITPRSTRKSPERMLAHKAKMEGKKYDRARRAGEKPKITVMSRNEIRRRFGPSIVRVNRHTGKPHEHAQEIMRRTMTPLQRKQFREGAVYEMRGPVSTGKMLVATQVPA